MSSTDDQVAWVRPLARADASCGGKAAHLATLRASGFDVPDGFVVEVSAWRRWTESGIVPPDVAETVTRAWRSLGAGPVAVRSSAIGEDGEEASFAGQFETVLDVRDERALLAAVERCWTFGRAGRVEVYEASRGVGDGGLALLVQRMVPARAAGVAFSADPVTGERLVCVSAVNGLGESLVSGEARGEDWKVEAGGPRRLDGPENVLQPTEVARIAELVRSVESRMGRPQDVEWALEGDELWLLQARPMTALPETPRWEVSVPEGVVRNLRLGEWLGDPVTPLLADWLLPRLEDRLHVFTLEEYGMELPRPAHVIVNGWYFYRVPGMPRGAKHIARVVAYSLRALILDPMRTLGYEPATAHLGLDRNTDLWRNEIWPAYEAAVTRAREVQASGSTDVFAAIDAVADRAGDHFVSMLAVAGTAAKTEGPLRAFWTAHLAGRVEGDPLELLRGFPTAPGEHAVQTLDWSFATPAELGVPPAPPPVEPLVKRRESLAAECRRALEGAPKLRKRFDKALALAQKAHRLREEQAAGFTLGWPVMRGLLRNLGRELVRRERLADPDDVYWLKRSELERAHRGERIARDVVTERRRSWRRATQLQPPLTIGEIPKHWRQVEALVTGPHQATVPEHALRGQPASPGLHRGTARVIRRLEDVGRLQPGEVLVARCTTPGWTPAFARAGAVVTDSGSAFSHAAVVAREYGIPSVVACGDATSRLRDGETVVVDGSRGWVEVSAARSSA